MTKIKHFFLAFQFLTAFSCYSQYVNLTNGKLVYTMHANKGETNNVNIIPDFSMCGYGGGGVAIPVGIVPVRETLMAPESGTSRAMIQDAIDRVSLLPLDSNGFRGAILLKAGTYYLNDGTYTVSQTALVISASGVVLRGEGQGTSGTVLISSLESKHTIIDVKPANDPTLQTINFTDITDSYVGTGAKSFNVITPSNFNVGDLITLRFSPNAQWLTDIRVNPYLNAGAGDILWDTTTYIVKFERKITAINGSTITIDAPVVMPMQTKYGLGQIGKLTITGRLTNVGVEDLRLQGPGVTATCLIDGTNRLEHGVKVWFGENYWVHGVTTVHSRYSCVSTWGSKFVTVEDCAYVQPYGPKSGGYRYSFNLDANSQFVLFQRCYANDGRHDFVTHARIPGPNAYVDCLSLKGSTEGPHERWAMGTLYDNCKMETQLAISEHRGASGSGHGWAGITQLAWNTVSPTFTCDTPLGFQNYIIGGTGTEVLSGYINHNQTGVYTGYYESIGSPITHTRSLYLKQLEDRLGSTAVSNITIPDQRNGNIYTKLASWAGNGKLLSPTVPVTPAGNGSEFIAQQNVPVFLGLSQNATVNVTMKNIGSTTWTKADGYKLGSQNTQDNTVWGFNRVELSDTDAILPGQEKTFQFAITAPSTVGNNNFQWKLLKGGVSGEWFGDVTPNTIIAIGAENYLDNCDSKTNWSLCNCTLVLNSVDKKQGLSSLEFTGPEIVEFSRVFSPAYNTVGSTTGATLQFWYYVSDASKLTTKNQVEIGSSGVPDTNEYNWTLTGLVNGWNLVILNTSTATKIGNPNLGAINWFRIHGLKTGSVTTRIDGIVLVGN
ncbi:hypothetical protein [Flavobacterium sp.]|uniref:hypothetical protein n=1 Tax=Flavobacterium sp. TaxID=239 RepID=UPI0038FC759A